MKRKILRRGAEAELRMGKWLGIDVIIKERVKKGYRHPVIDSKLRIERMKTEARLFREARKLAVAVPVIYELDLSNNRIIMEHVPGKQVKEILNDSKIPQRKKEQICRQIGELVGRLHAGDIAHGDLTTSNMIIDGKRICMIDFSMGSRNADIEKKGVDIHLLKEAFQSAHSSNFHLFSYVLIGYLKSYSGGREIISKMREIEERGRYARQG